MSEPTEPSDATTIRTTRNGPLTVRGPLRLEGSDGATWTDIPEGTNVALCRCGQSKVRPFCDGSHNAAKFDSAPTPDAQPYPW